MGSSEPHKETKWQKAALPSALGCSGSPKARPLYDWRQELLKRVDLERLEAEDVEDPDVRRAGARLAEERAAVTLSCEATRS